MVKSAHRQGCRFAGCILSVPATLALIVTLSPLPAQDAPAARDDPSQVLVVVVGAPGAEEYGAQFAEWATRLKQAAESGGVTCVLVGLDEHESATADSQTDRDRLRQLISEYGSVETSEPLWLIMLGHGTWDNRQARFSLRGPDVASAELAEMCSTCVRPLAVVGCFSCSAPFLNALSGPNRVVVTATKDGNQVQWSRFGEAFTQALVTSDSDIDRDGQTSLLEAWLYASRRTAEFYESEGRLATEHSLLDDNADEKGTRADAYDGFRPAANLEQPDQIDGRLAARWHLVRSDEEQRLTAEQRQMRDELERQLEELRAVRDSLPEPDYLNQMESILLELARIYQEADQQHVPQ